MKDHEKFFAFVLLGGSLVAFGFMIYMRPLPDSQANSGALQLLNMIIGALIGAFGAAAGQLLKASTDTVKIDQGDGKPVPTTDSGPTPPPAPSKEELPDYAR